MQNAGDTWPGCRLACGFCGFVCLRRDRAASWASYYRAIYCTGHPDDPITSAVTITTPNQPQLSGVGSHQSEPADKTVPPLAHQRYDDADLDPSTCVNIRDIKPPGPDVPPEERPGYAWGFFFHEACWNLLEQALKPDAVDIEALWRILQSVPCGSALPNWGHNYGGLYMGTVKDLCKGEHFVLMEPNSYLVIPSTHANPFRIPEVEKVVSSLRIRHDCEKEPAAGGVRTLAAAAANGNGVSRSTTNDPFARLPQELRELLLCYLESPDVVSLRWASREIAGLPLSQLFFRSRFWPGRELHVFFDAFLLPPAEMRGTDWARLYRHYKTKLRYVGLGERNRLRIWTQTVKPLADAMRIVSTLSPLRGGGRLDSEPRRWGLDNDDDAAELMMMDWKAIKTARCRTPEAFGELGRVLLRAEVELPPNKPVRGVYVSLMPFFGLRYVTGLRFVFGPTGGSSDAATTVDNAEDDVELGYVLRGKTKKQQQQQHDQHDHEHAYEGYLPVDDQSLVGFCAAIDECGFRALSLLTGKPMMSEYLDWVGELGALPAVAIKTRGDGGLRRVRAAFDGFRMQALFVPVAESS